jgi:hypothetical protein
MLVRSGSLPTPGSALIRPGLSECYSDLAKIGLKKVVKSDKGADVVIPTTAAKSLWQRSTALRCT